MKPCPPEQFRITPELAERLRLPLRIATTSDYGNNGMFYIPHVGVVLRCMVSDSTGDGGTGLARWEHVSVSLPNRCPTWAEMCFVKDQFFEPEDVVMQLHPRHSEYVNNHPFCLHLWRPIDQRIPEPPTIMVGIK